MTTVGWMILGTSIWHRTDIQDRELSKRVQALWGAPQSQTAPEIYCHGKNEKGKDETYYLQLASSDIQVDFNLEHRKKGLLWYSTYKVAFAGRYLIKNPTNESRKIYVKFLFPAQDAIYDNFKFLINGTDYVSQVDMRKGVIAPFSLEPGGDATVEITYRSQGLNQWIYHLSSSPGRDNITRVQNLTLKMSTDFKSIDFPSRTLSPTEKVKTSKGWKLTWKYDSLISGFQIGMSMPKKLNPGPVASRISFFAPISLLFFIVIILMISVIRDINIHPMNYFFLSAAFFAFHLLFAYLVDHIQLHTAFLIATLTSIALVVSYLRLVTGLKFALVEAGISQLVYMVLFSYAFFYRGYTGLSITIVAILTLAVMMQLTGRINWDEKFTRRKKNSLKN